MQTAGYGMYQQIQTETSSPGELLLLLYGALHRKLLQAETALEARDWEAAHPPLLLAQEIVLELTASLDMESGELAEQLAALYDYCYRRLVDANVKKDPDAVREVQGLTRPLREAWTSAVQATMPAAVEGVHRG